MEQVPVREVEKLKESDKAYQLRVKGAEFADGTDTAWFPKSACEMSDDGESADIADWIIDRKIRGDPGQQTASQPITVNNASAGTEAVVDAIRDAAGDIMVALDAGFTRLEKFFRDGGEEE